MIRFSRLADYAVVILTAFATCDETQMSASALSLRTHLPEPTVAKVLKLLVKSGVLRSERGIYGGYCLARRPADISIAAIIEAVDGPIGVTACVEGSAQNCDLESVCPLRGRWDVVNNAVYGALSGISLADMLKAPLAIKTEKDKVQNEYL